MIIIDYKYNKFSEVNHLNKNFIHGINKLKVTIDVMTSAEVYQEIYPKIAKEFNMLFPNLKKHQCCNKKLPGVCKSTLKPQYPHYYILNVIHLIEHVIIEIQCTISKMQICSGITCNYYIPSNRYDIFVECIDEEVGFYGTQLAVELVQQILCNNQFYGNPGIYYKKQQYQPTSVLSKKLSYLTTQKSDFPSYVSNSILNACNIAKN